MKLLVLGIPTFILVAFVILIRARRPLGCSKPFLRPRARKLVGAGLVVLGIALLFGGQGIALPAAKARVAESAPEVMLPVPAPGAEDPEGPWLVRFLTIGAGRPGELRLLDHRSFVLEAGERAEGETNVVGDVDSITAAIELTGGSVPDSYHASLETASMTIATGSGLGHGQARWSTLGAIARSVAGRPLAAYPDASFPPFVQAQTIILLDPAPAGTEERSFREILATADGDRIREAWADSEGGRSALTSTAPGFFRAFGGWWAYFAIILTGAGIVLLVSHVGFAIAIAAALAPALLAGADRVAFSVQESALTDDRPAVRAAAMAGLAASPFYAPSGREELRRLAMDGDADAAWILRALPGEPPRERRWIDEEAHVERRTREAAGARRRR